MNLISDDIIWPIVNKMFFVQMLVHCTEDKKKLLKGERLLKNKSI